MTPEEHNKYISWTFLANGLFQSSMLLLVFGFFILFFVFGLPPDEKFPGVFFAVFFSFILLINLAFISPNFIAYYALKNRKPWARIASIVAAVLGAMNMPIGTAACVYSLWFFFGEEWKSLYPETAGATPHLQQLGNGQQNWEGRYVRQDGEVVYQPSNPPDWR
jgi:hypothetical protein